ncbi:MAG: sulfatase [Candidatus Hydrogenedentes bacterium]|nr:sulfatase [Candidatus Hydrogenedentota bacterium]
MSMRIAEYMRLIWAAVAVLFLVSGCRKPAEEAFPQRFLRTPVSALQESRPPGQQLSLAAARPVRYAEMKHTDDGVQLSTANGLGSVYIPCAIDTQIHNVLRVRMKVSTGGYSRISWTGPIAPHLAPGLPKGGMRQRIIGDDEWHEYHFRVGATENTLWAGDIEGLQIFPSESAAVSVIGSIELQHDPESIARRITISDVTMEAGFGTQQPWKLRVPEHGRFSAHIGIVPAGMDDYAEGSAVFTLSVTPEDGKRALLLRRELLPGIVSDHRKWVAVEADLEAYAGQTVVLNMEAHKRISDVGDYAYWGNPMLEIGAARRTEAAAAPVILISCDTLRADRLSVYGYARETSPFLKSWAATDAVVFESASTPMTWTLPSHMSMLTGLYPQNHHVITGNIRLPGSIVTLPEFLQEQGYHTAGFTGLDIWLSPKYGFADGFDYYDVPGDVFRHIYETYARVEDWLSAPLGGRRFLFFHNYDIHAKVGSGYAYPYDSGDREFLPFSRAMRNPKLFSDALEQGYRGFGILEAQLKGKIHFSPDEHAFLSASYDDCIRMVDYQLAVLVQSLMDKGLYDDALIVITSDHGESLNDHGQYEHYTAYREVSHVPLIVKFPKQEFGGRRFGGLVETVDIMPTVMDVLGIPGAVPVDGISLRAMLAGTAAPHEMVFSTQKEHFAVEKEVLRVHEFRHEAAGEWGVFNLAEDPLEQNMLPLESMAGADTLKLALDQHYEMDASGWHLALTGGDAARINVQLTSSSSFTQALTVTEGEKAPVSRAGTEPLYLNLNTVSKHLLVKVADPALSVHAVLQSNTPFTVHLNEPGASAPALEWQNDLVSGATRYASRAAAEAGAAPQVAIWYQEAGTALETVAGPTEEEVESLKALGYLGD